MKMNLKMAGDTFGGGVAGAKGGRLEFGGANSDFADDRSDFSRASRPDSDYLGALRGRD